MENFIEEGAARYDAALAEGQRFIKKCWPALQAPTRLALVESGFYSPRAERLEVEYPSRDFPRHDIERLEYALGVLVRCRASSLPQRNEAGATIPVEALESGVLTCVGELLYVPAWHDPNFLRMALYAVAMHLKANALTMVGPPRSSSVATTALTAVLKAVLFLALPASLAMALVSVGRHDVVDSILWLYAVGAGLLCAMSAMKVGLPKPEPFELAYEQWTRFQFDEGVGVTGAGALEYLRKMAAEGVRVPPVMFDLADSLRCRMGVVEFSEPTKSTPSASAAA